VKEPPKYSAVDWEDLKSGFQVTIAAAPRSWVACGRHYIEDVPLLIALVEDLARENVEVKKIAGAAQRFREAWGTADEGAQRLAVNDLFVALTEAKS
jgi:hypothetical protein